jgi:hypothetical protein
MARDNSKLHDAKRNKNDEFYTLLEEIEKELINYKDHFKNKIIYCNCDDPVESNFYKYFALNFDFFGLKKLITTHYDESKPTYKLELMSYGKEPIKTNLRGNGDIRNEECIEILKEADIVVTNPPFSLFVEYTNQLLEYNKKFLIIGNLTAISNYNLFPLIKENKVWLGVTKGGTFEVPKEYFDDPDITGVYEKDGKYYKKVGVYWYTNLENQKYKESLLKLLAGNKYDPEKYPKYDNTDIIHTGKLLNIPCDYYGEMGVPITFVEKYNPDEFELVGLDELLNKERIGKKTRFYINGKRKFARLVVKRRRKNGDK